MKLRNIIQDLEHNKGGELVMDEVKKAIIECVNMSKAKHPVILFQELLLLLYSVGYSDGQKYTEVREE